VIRAALILALLAPHPLFAHPLHTSITIVSYDRASGRLDVSVRVFADDFERAAAKRALVLSASHARESPFLSYIRASFLVTDANGRSIPFEWCGWRRQGDLVWLCFRGTNRARGTVMITDRIFHDLYDDQINVVQATSDGRRTNLLFTKGDKARLIR
jgi:uncharacterized protein DUF6702